MCVVSMVMDHFKPFVPDDWNPKPTHIDFTGAQIQWPPPKSDEASAIEALRGEIATLAKVVADFKVAVEAARKVDVLTAQPDCEDPEKVKLEGRVAELERRLDAVSKALGA
jgi:hypothetical protein